MAVQHGTIPPPALQQRAPSLSKKQWAGLILGAVLFALPFFFNIPGLEAPGQRMLSIFLLAIVFWILEPIPLTATAVLVIFFEVILLSKGAIVDPTGGAEALKETVLPASDYFAALANPVIILFLGGFMIAHGAEKFGLDKNLAAIMLRPFPDKARLTVLGLMLITALLSMFMSNTATTATMFAVVIPILRTLPPGKVRAGVALSIPLAANVGGIGTPVGTPPNAIAIGALAEYGIKVSFAQWMLLAVPFMLVVLVFAWLFLCIAFIPSETRISIAMDASWDTSSNAKLFYAVAGLTIALWMSEPLHGISSNIVGFFPVVALLSLKVMKGKDVQALDWPVLWLVSGGIALGTGVGATGLDDWLVGSVNWKVLGPMMILALLGLIGFAMANVISHSAAANLLVPLAVSLAITLSEPSPMLIAVIVAIACSLGMALPISTPPNAIAYATKEITIPQMAQVGLVVGTVATLLLIFVMPSVWTLLGLL
ncbi:transporter [Corynebacterium sp. NML98-0116]|uniref:SLC13 family permease n=1 Tax=unclassified Corynebacterium TaxID=2624378 RepID=UPI0008786E19|nr:MULTISPECIES: DASS family sodium-coupled anion symporter [unclassified Corynebacterium]AOX06038.1 transporter [Corynebacterium sp. NML98-0116]MDK8243487.1 DASS family sodium-coupled anion symporter [Corynebacterium sp. UMB10321]